MAGTGFPFNYCYFAFCNIFLTTLFPDFHLVITIATSSYRQYFKPIKRNLNDNLFQKYEPFSLIFIKDLVITIATSSYLQYFKPIKRNLNDKPFLNVLPDDPYSLFPLGISLLLLLPRPSNNTSNNCLITNKKET